MWRRCVLALVLAAVATACGRQQWPSPPPIDQGTYQKEHETWLAGERTGETQVESVLIGPFRLDVTGVGDDRRWVAATDTTHPAITAPPPLPSYPLDPQTDAADA